jgi:hypothetical protein
MSARSTPRWGTNSPNFHRLVYRVFTAAAEMEDEYQQHQTTLLMQYGRLVAFRKAAGLIQSETNDLPGSLQAEKYTLVAILSEMQILMEGFQHIMRKYKSSDAAVKDKIKRKVETTEHLLEGFEALSYEPQPRAKRSRNPFSRQFFPQMHDKAAGLLDTTKTLIVEPGRFIWVLFDDEEFLKGLDRLTRLNDFLDGLLRGREAKILEDCTRKSQRDIVMIKNTVDQLENLLLASIMLQDRRAKFAPNTSEERRSDKILDLLTKAKKMKLAGDQVLDSPPSYSASTKPSPLGRSRIVDLEQHVVEANDEKVRAPAKLQEDEEDEGRKNDIWIEWRTYRTEYDMDLKCHVPRKKEIRRIELLVSLLISKEPDEFCLPTCLGYFDDRGDKDHQDSPCRFGLVFQSPAESSVPISLHSLLATGLDEDEEDLGPSLTVRAALASKVATCILYLHAISWLHHDIRSHNIIFLNSSNLTEPRLSGFDYSRPDTVADQTMPSSEGEIPDENILERERKLDLARHPDYQGLKGKKPYCKSFDVYSLGIVLLEIALWERIEDTVEYPEKTDPEYLQKQETIENEFENKPKERATAFAELDDQLVTSQKEKARNLKSELERPDSKIMNRLRVNFGDKYHKAVLSCIQGGKAFGIEEDANELDGLVGMKFQRGFTEVVVDALAEIET